MRCKGNSNSSVAALKCIEKQSLNDGGQVEVH